MPCLARQPWPGLCQCAHWASLMTICSQKGKSYCKCIPLFRSSQLCVCPGSAAMAESQKVHTLFSQGDGCVQAHVCIMKRAIEVSQGVKGQLLYIKKKKKSELTMELYYSSLHIRKPGSRDHKQVLQSHTACVRPFPLFPCTSAHSSVDGARSRCLAGGPL